MWRTLSTGTNSSDRLGNFILQKSAILKPLNQSYKAPENTA